MRKRLGIFAVLGLVAAIWLAFLVWHYKFQPHYRVNVPSSSANAQGS